MFLDAALRAGVTLVLFATGELEAADVDELLNNSKISLDRDQERDYQSRLRKMAIYVGVTCSLELAFTLDSRLYVLRTAARLVEEFLVAEEQIANTMAEGEMDEGGDWLGGYFFDFLH